MLNSDTENEQLLLIKLKNQRTNLKKRSKLCRKATHKNHGDIFLLRKKKEENTQKK